MPVAGIDVSKYQGTVDWAKVKADPLKPVFVYMRGTIGVGAVDPKFETYYAAAKAVGLKVGMYHLIWPPDGVDGAVKAILEQCKNKEFDLPVALDVEQNHGLTPTQLGAHVKALCDGLQAAGQRVVIYTGAWFWNPRMPRAEYWKQYPLWTASYTSSPILPNDWVTWTIWQKTSSYKMQGITQNTVDVNEFNGDIAKFMEWIGQKLEPVPLPEPKPDPVPDHVVIDVAAEYLALKVKNKDITRQLNEILSALPSEAPAEYLALNAKIGDVTRQLDEVTDALPGVTM